MRSDSTRTMVGAAIVAALLGILLGFGFFAGDLTAILLIALATAYVIGMKAKTPEEPWLPKMMVLAMGAKLFGSWVRYYALVVVYHGSGDAGRYHVFARSIAETWRAFQVPDMATVAFGSQGTRFTSWIAGLLYAPIEPSMLGGFWIFSLLAFLGQFFLYLAFRTAIGTSGIKRYAILIFFWPTLVYWPSSIGKEGLILPFLGLGSWAAAQLYRRYHVRWLPIIAGSAFLISMVRVHVAALFAGSLIAGILLGKRPAGSDIGARKAFVLLIGVVAAVPLALGVGQKFGVDLGSSLSLDDLDPVFSDVGDTTGQGGSAVSSGVIKSPADIPAGILKVLFRPLPNEANNLQMLVASVEGLLLLGLIMWRSPRIFANARLLRQSPYLMFSAIYSALFIWAWSAIQNLGILSRQRSLMIPFILALVAALGWDREERAPSPHPALQGEGSIPSTTEL